MNLNPGADGVFRPSKPENKKAFFDTMNKWCVQIGGTVDDFESKFGTCDVHKGQESVFDPWLCLRKSGQGKKGKYRDFQRVAIPAFQESALEMIEMLQAKENRDAGAVT